MEHSTPQIYTEFLPISRADMEARGWDCLLYTSQQFIQGLITILRKNKGICRTCLLYTSRCV